MKLAAPQGRLKEQGRLDFTLCRQTEIKQTRNPPVLLIFPPTLIDTGVLLSGIIRVAIKRQMSSLWSDCGVHLVGLNQVNLSALRVKLCPIRHQSEAQTSQLLKAIQAQKIWHRPSQKVSSGETLNHNQAQTHLHTPRRFVDRRPVKKSRCPHRHGPLLRKLTAGTQKSATSP